MEAPDRIISEIADDDALRISARTIRDSFKTVAAEFGLTKENCPTHPSFMNVRRLCELRDRGIKLFGCFLGKRQVGFVAIERADDDLYYMERLAVLPEYRHRGCGTELVRFVLDYIREQGGQKLSIGTINEHWILKDWYRRLGFAEIRAEKFPHLPFTVCFMERDTGPLQSQHSQRFTSYLGIPLSL